MHVSGVHASVTCVYICMLRSWLVPSAMCIQDIELIPDRLDSKHLYPMSHHTNPKQDFIF